MKHVLLFCAGLWMLMACTTSRQAHSKNAGQIILLDTLDIVVPKERTYQASATKIFDLQHTRLEVRFDWKHQWLYGHAEITLKPHAYAQQRLSLDARNMDMYSAHLLRGKEKLPLAFSYDSTTLLITLDKEYDKDESLTIAIDYKARPNERKSGGSTAIQDDKGLYFINPLREDSTHTPQIWTQGETESNSYWFPTIDKPNQKCTGELWITVENKYVTLSNGLLVAHKENGDGTRTDHWKMDLPHSPYLFFMAVGEFDITHDRWRDKEVTYYTEPKYTPFARRIFGETPAMMEFFSNKLGVPYPWQKYAQVIVREYVSGAMENTSATLHSEMLNRNARQLLDEDYHDYISHELFHQWFGDYVTCESWSNLPLNESFADYGEYLWNEHRYGREYADWKGRAAVDKYLLESATEKNVDLIRYYYQDREDMFDAHSYEKGGRVLHMLRKILGDEIFFQSLQLYLKTNAFKATEIHHLRLAVEEVSGRDMNWFFNQWFFHDGHPLLDINYSYTNDSVRVKINQRQSTDKGLVYELPMRLDIHYGNIVESKNIVLKKKEQIFVFPALGTPDLIDADADRALLCVKTENKTTAQWIFQYKHGKLYDQRKEALDSLRSKQKYDSEVRGLYRAALRDNNPAIRAYAAKHVWQTATNKDTLWPLLRYLAQHDAESQVRAAALGALCKLKDKTVLPDLERALGDSSYAVVSSALEAIHQLDSLRALKLAKNYEHEDIQELRIAVANTYAISGDSTHGLWFQKNLQRYRAFPRFYAYYYYANYLCRMSPAQAIAGMQYMSDLAQGDTNRKGNEHACRSIARVRECFEKKKENWEKVLNSDAATRMQYNEAQLKREVTEYQQVIMKAKALEKGLDIK